METGGIITLPSGAAFIISSGGQTAIFTPRPNATDLGSWIQGPTFPKDTTTNPSWPTLIVILVRRQPICGSYIGPRHELYAWPLVLNKTYSIYSSNFKHLLLGKEARIREL